MRFPPHRRSFRIASILVVAFLGIAWRAAIPAAPRPSGGAGTPAPVDWDGRALDRLKRPPLGLPPVPLPPGPPPTREMIGLGRKLFFDRRLSFNGTMSCGMCHIPEQGFTNNELATPVGFGGRTLRRNAPTVLNAAYLDPVFLDGRETSLETQILGPLLAPNEMANPAVGGLLARIDSLDDYAGRFERAFGGRATIERVGQALAAWQRTLLAGNTPFDRWRYGGEESALDDEQKRGFGLFTGRAGCAGCHHVGEREALFTDRSFHDTGIGYLGEREASETERPLPVEIAPGVHVPLDRAVLRAVSEPRQPDLGRYEITLRDEDRWRFRTPSLRNVALTAPYMHDGSLRTLEDVVRFYDRGGVEHEGLDPLLRPLGLSDAEVRALVAFLRGLSSDDAGILEADARSVEVGN